MRILGITIMRTSELETERAWSKIQADDLRTVIHELRGRLDENRQQLDGQLSENFSITADGRERECAMKATISSLEKKVASLEARVRDLSSPVTTEDCIRAVEEAARRKQEMHNEAVSRAKDMARKARARKRIQDEK